MIYSPLPLSSLTVAVPVCLLDHLLHLVLADVLAQLVDDPLQVAEGDLAAALVVEESKHLGDLLLAVAVGLGGGGGRREEKGGMREGRGGGGVPHKRRQTHKLVQGARPLRRHRVPSCCCDTLRTASSTLTHTRTIFPVIMSTNSWKSTVPFSSLSMSAIIFRTSAFFTWKPRARIAALSSLASMDPAAGGGEGERRGGGRGRG
jgi:hypothetical protein